MITIHFPRFNLYLALAIIFCALVPTSTLTIYYAQTQGMCLKAGRVLSADELRKAVLMDLVANEIEGHFAYNWKKGNDNFWAGINSHAQEINIQNIINASFINMAINNMMNWEHNLIITY